MLAKAIWLQHPIVERPDPILVFLHVPIQRRQVQVARGLAPAEVVVVGLKQIVDDQAGPVENDAGALRRMFAELLTGEQGVEDEPRVGLCGGLDLLGLHGAGVGRVGLADVGVHDVVIAAIGLAVLELVAEVGHWRVLEGVEERVNEAGGVLSVYGCWYPDIADVARRG